ncbi:hypothetical protein LAZ67_1006165, partial [Cordylochernes scorpioides]
MNINVDRIGICEAFIDTGADLSVVDLNTALNTGLEIINPDKMCSGPDGKELDIVGNIILNIKFDDKTITNQFVIMRTHLRIFILGRDFLKKMNAKIDCQREIIKYDLTENRDVIKYQQKKIKSAKDAIIPELSIKLINAFVEAEDGEYIIEENHKMFQTNGLRLARSLINVVNKETYIWITNPYPRPLKILKNQTLCFGSQPAEVNLVEESEQKEHEEPQFQINENLAYKEKEQLKQVLERYEDLFSSGLGRSNLAKHRIDTEGAKPIKHKPYRVSAKEREIIKEQIDEMLRDGIIRPSSSPWSFPVILVKKRDGKYRFCVDHRKLNDVTVKDVYPIPRIDDVMDTLQGSKYFSAIDLRSGYWQVEIEEKDKEKTAFTTTHGLYEFNVMPFGLCNAPATFERNMDNVLGNLRWQICLCYLDDVIIYSSDFPTHLKRLEAVLKCFSESNLKLNDKKCRFAFEELEILGHITNQQGIKPAEYNIKAVRDFPQPKKVKEIQSFLGMCSYYRKFIKDFSLIADPLTGLIRKNAQFTWTEKQEEAFQNLKKALINPPILGHFDPNAATYIHTDASNIGLGATLVQIICGEEKVISYLSRTLSKAEQNYSTTEKECLAVVWAISKLRPYLYGRHFKIITDHHALCWLKNLKDPTGRLARWALKIQEYDFDIIHKSGKKHMDADGLSRGPLPEMDWVEDYERLFLIQIINEEDEFIENVKKSLKGSKRAITQNFKEENGCLYKKNPNPEGRAWLLVVPKKRRKEIMSEFHNHMLNGHLGVARTTYRLKNKYHWPSMLKDVSEFVKTCHLCQSRKGSNQSPSGLLQPIPPAKYPFERIGIDFVGPLPSTKRRRKWIIVLTDYYTRDEELMQGKVEERSYVVYSKQAAVSRGRTAAYRRRLCTSWKILEGSTNFSIQAMQAQNQETREAIQTQNKETREALNEALQAQNQETREAIRAQNQALQAQNQALQAQNQETREAIQAQNQALQAQNQETQEMKDEISSVKEDVSSVKEEMKDKLSALEERLAAVETGHTRIPVFQQENNNSGRPLFKVPTFDGQSSWTSFKTQFDVVAQANGWNDRDKASFLADALRGPAVDVLQMIPEQLRLDFNALIDVLESRYGEEHYQQLHVVKFKNRLQEKKEIRVVNLYDSARAIKKGSFLGNAEPAVLIKRNHPVMQKSKREDNVTDHLQQVWEETMKELQPGKQKELAKLLATYGNIYAKSSEDYGSTDLTKHRINTEVHSDNKEKAEFTTGSGLWQFNVMPFGLCNAPATFARLMEAVLQGLATETCMVYLDDIIVLGKNFEENSSNIEKVFERLEAANQKLSSKKCKLFKKEVTYLGHIISTEGVQTDLEKTETVRMWPTPKDLTQLRSFLGLCTYYRRFIPGFSDIARPLHRLTESGRPFVWTPDCQRTMEKLKEMLVAAPILAYPRPGDSFILETDARNGRARMESMNPGSWCYPDLMYLWLSRRFIEVPREVTSASEIHWPKLEKDFFWPESRADVEIWCRNCTQCSSRKGPTTRSKGKLKIYNVGAPFERVAIDVVGSFPKSDLGNKYILVIMDYFTKWPVAVPIPDQEASTLSEALLKDWVCIFGVPKILHSHQGRNFESNIFQELCRRLGIEKTRTTPLHPQSYGMVERFNRTLTQHLTMFVDKNQREWDQHHPMLLMAHRSAEHESTGYCPARMDEELMQGKVEERSYVLDFKQAAVPRGRTAAYRRRRCTSWKILEGSTNFCLPFCSCFPSPCCSCYMVCFDIESLYTSIPHEEAILALQEFLNNHPEIILPIPKEALIDLIELCLALNYFGYKDRYFKQEKGLPMGNPVSSALANIYMDKIDKIIADTAQLQLNGGILSQVQEGSERVIAYFSKTLSKPERNYCVTRKELLAIVKSIEHFHHYLYGQEIILRSDHASLQCLLNFKNPEGPTTRSKGKLKIYNVGAPFERVAIDVVGSFPKSDLGNKYILVIMDYFTKWPVAVPIPDQEASTLSEALLKDWVCIFGVPKILHSHQGRNFESNIFQELCRRLGIEKTRTTPLHPQSYGMVERFNRTLTQHLTMFVDKNQREWDQHHPMLLMAHRSAEHESTGYCPARMDEELMQGKVEERSYVLDFKQAAVPRGRTAAYRRRRCTSWKILEGSTNFCLPFCSCFPSPCCSCYMVCFDIESLYTSIPHEEAILALQEFLNNHPEIILPIPKEALIDLIELCLALNYFGYKDRYFKQEKGLPMGNPVSSALANIYMDKIDKIIADTAQLQ